MGEISLIAAVDENWGIGYENALLFHLKTDMKFFREKTKGNIVIMGRKTMESLPGGKPLADRINIVLTHEERESFLNGHPAGDSWIVFHTVAEVMDHIENTSREIYVIGGEMVYREFEPYASRAFITKIEKEKRADAFFPNLDAMSGWEMISSGKRFCEDGVWGEFVEYERHGK